MTTKQLCAVLVAVVGVVLAGGGRASAQGKVTWAGGAAPVPVQKNLPFIPNAYVDVKGVCTLDPPPPAWFRSTISFNYHLQAGGPVTGVTLARLGDDVGELNGAATAIVPKQVVMTTGTYTVQIVCIYTRTDPNDPTKTISAAVACGGTVVIN